MFYNEITQKTAYVLIKKSKRIFGADNTGGWHKHTFEKPEGHVPSEEIDFENFLKEINSNLNKLR